MAQVSKVFFKELTAFKDSMFSERDFHQLRGGFAKACPHSNLRLKNAHIVFIVVLYGRTTKNTLS